MSTFIKWFFAQIIFPTLPIFIVWLVEYYFEFGSSVFPDEKILIFAFLFPVIHLQEAPTQEARNMLYMVSTLCLVLYVLAIFAAEPSIARNHPEVLGQIYSTGFWVAVVEITAATLMKLWTLKGTLGGEVR